MGDVGTSREHRNSTQYTPVDEMPNIDGTKAENPIPSALDNGRIGIEQMLTQQLWRLTCCGCVNSAEDVTSYWLQHV